MKNTLCILHLTDPHLLADRQARLHGWLVQSAFDQVLTAALRAYPDADALLLGGDLVDDESAAGYQRLDAQMAALGIPVLAIAGNHDAPQRMQRFMPHVRVHDRLRLGSWQLIGLNTHIDGQDAGTLDPTSLARLDRCLATDDRHALIGLHHPPWPLGSRWMDAIGLSNAEALRRPLDNARQSVGLVCGHAHQAAVHRLWQRPAWITPSTMRQFLPRSDAFAEDGAAPAFRQLTLHDDGRMTSRVHRVPEARSAGPRGNA